MEGYDWPGNVRELENVISRAALKASSGVPRNEAVIIDAAHLESDLIPVNHRDAAFSKPNRSSVPSKDLSLNDAVKNYKRECIKRAIDKNQGNISAAARDLKMNRSNLYNLSKQLGIIGNKE